MKVAHTAYVFKLYLYYIYSMEILLELLFILLCLPWKKIGKWLEFEK